MNKLSVLVACEESGRVRDAFIAQGHDAMSCDLQPCETGGNHYQGDVSDLLGGAWEWDLMIAHPPCTFLCLSSARWFYHPDDDHLHTTDRRPHPHYPDRMDDFEKGIEFFLALQNAPIPKICIENSTPLGRTIHHAGRPTQIVQPWWFGSPYAKGAALWLKGLRPLVATHEEPEVITPETHYMSPGAERTKLRSRTPYAIAEAMAVQWGTDFDHTTLNQGSLF